MSVGGKGGGQTQTTQIPAWLENAAQENLERARYASQIGYTPYYGPDVAALSAPQQQAMQATGAGMQAFGLAGPSYDPLAGMPQPQTFDGGVQGYSSGGLFDQALGQLQQRRPAQYDAITGMFIDPVTGERGVEFTPFGSFAGQGSAGANLATDSSGATPMESAGRFAAGRFGLEGGNTAGYSPNQYVELGMGLKGLPRFGLMGLIGNELGEQLIGYDVEDINGTPTITTRGSFDQGAFSGGDDSPTDVSGGATGSNVATNQYGDKVSVGYGYGQVDPAIAKAAGYTTGSQYMGRTPDSSRNELAVIPPDPSDPMYQQELAVAAMGRTPTQPPTVQLNLPPTPVPAPSYNGGSQGGGDSGSSSPPPSNAVTDRHGNAATDRHGNAVTFGNNDSSSGGSSSSGSSGGGCFITTATTHALGYEDDNNPILTAFRAFRDQYMGGKQGEASTYYEVAPKIVEAIDGDKGEYKRIWDKWLEPAYNNLLSGDLDGAYDKYKAMTLELKKRWID